MKKLFYLMLLLPVLLMGCKKGTEEPEAVKLAVEPNSIISPSMGADYTLTLTAPEAWTATCADSWVKVTPSSGNAGTMEISVKIAADKTSTEANSKIVFKSGDQTVEVPVKRLAKDPARLMVVSETEIQTPKDGGIYSIKVESNIKWQISSNASWAKIEGQATKRDNAIISVTVDPATTPEETVATLTISPLEGNGVEKQTVTITRGSTEATSLSVDQKSFDVSALGTQGGTRTVNVTSNAKWKAYVVWPANEWISLVTSEGTNDGSFKFRVEAATTKEPTVGIIKVEEKRSDNYKPVKVEIRINREGKADAVLDVTPIEINAPYQGGDFPITIKSNYGWTATTVSASLLSLSTTDRSGNGTPGSGDATLIVTVKPTTSANEKTGSVFITSKESGEKVTISIRRYGKPVITPHAFSVSAKKKVYFSPGNLQYQPSTGIWRFAEQQYHFVGAFSTGNVYNENTNRLCGNENKAKDYDGWIDLYGFGTGGDPLLISNDGMQFTTFTDWGINPISNGGNTANQWRTLTAAEWDYLLNDRIEPMKATSLRGLATVNGVPGCIFLPDDWVFSSDYPFTANTQYADPNSTDLLHPKYLDTYTKNNYTLDMWNKFEEKGAIFLPAAGGYSYYYSNASIPPISPFGIEKGGYYWSSTRTETLGRGIFFGKDIDNTWGKIQIYDHDLYYGHSVRLVQDVN